jgi:hypothetical protein
LDGSVQENAGRSPVIIVAVAVALAAIMLGAGNKASAGNGSSRAQIEPVVLSGTGDGVSKKFTMKAGVMALHIVYGGMGFFIVNFYNESGYFQRTLADEKGPFEGSTLIEVTEPRPSAADALTSVDSTPPKTAISVNGAAENGWYNGPVTVHLAALDARSGDITLEDDGAQIIRYYSDEAGNHGQEASLSINIGGTAPITVYSVAPQEM